MKDRSAKYGWVLAAILALALAVRLANGFAPLLGAQQWRQCDTASIAKNFHERGMNILYPTVNWAGDGPGYAETEFQLYTFTVAALYRVFGFHDFIGRLVSILCSIVAIYYLFSLTRLLAGEPAASWAAFLYAVLPLAAYYSTTFQPESAYMMCAAAGLFHLASWSVSNDARALFAGSAFLSLACLLKITNLHLAVPVLYILRKKYGNGLFERRETWTIAAIALVPTAAWYLHAYRLGAAHGTTFGIWDAGSGKWLSLMFLEPAFWRKFLLENVAIKHLAVAGLPLALIGALEPRTGPLPRLFDAWALSFAAFALIAPLGNFLHEYYQLPLAMACCHFMGIAMASPLMGRATKTLYTLAICVASAFIYYNYLMLQYPEHSPEMEMAAAARSVVTAGSPVICVSSGRPDFYFPGRDPVFFYHSGTRGWSVSALELDHSLLADRMRRGALYICGSRAFFALPDKKAFLTMLASSYELAASHGDAFVYRLR